MALGDPKARTLSRSGKLIINFGEIDIQNLPATIDLGITPNDIIKVLGKDFFISWSVDVLGGYQYEISPIYFANSSDENDFAYSLTPEKSILGTYIVFESTTPNSTIWNVTV